ncbi:hypothetical protein [Kineosporia sp. NBRC 101731]|uniref:hypothetical protein n=1 Tax=Kineosporia sp. NBRC 101731 TaxID=3032199 RepID=UPI0024A06F4A|nr:hypothetical protein [Kineosporia sp. NBRC 101731]GLY27242.1 hypothetical protein Kisp02_06070 [Kineosporia sp. NBRC 101731]
MTYSPVPELNALWDFQAEHGFESFAQGFGLYDTFGARDDLAPGWCHDDAFHARLASFAQATAGGSIYALWRADDGTQPVVVFGDEGGIQVVAADVRDFLRVLSFDGEPSVDWDRVYYFKSDEDEPSPAHEEFVAWLGLRALEPVAEADPLVEVAQERYGQEFSTWLGQFQLGD